MILLPKWTKWGGVPKKNTIFIFSKSPYWSLCWFSTDRSIIIIKCTRKGIYTQHLLCNTPLLKLNQLAKVADTFQIHLMYTHQILWMVVISGRQWQRRGVNYVLAHHFTLNRLGGYQRTSVWQSLSRKWSTSVALKYFTKGHIPPWRCSDVITDHWSFYWVLTKQSTQKIRTSSDWK